MPAADDTAGRTGEDEVHRGAGGCVQTHLAAVRLDDDRSGANPRAIETGSGLRQLPGDDGTKIGVGDCGRGPLVLLPFRQDFVGNRDRHVAPELRLQYALGVELVIRIEVGKEEANRDRLDLRHRPDLCGDRPHLRLIQRDQNVTVSVDTLVEFEAMSALGQRLWLHPAHVVVEFAIAALDENDVPVAAGRQVGDRCPLSFKDGVGRYGGPETDRLELRPASKSLEASDDAGNRIARYRRHFPNLNGPGPGIIGYKVCKRATNIDAEQSHACTLSRLIVPGSMNARTTIFVEMQQPCHMLQADCRR